MNAEEIILSGKKIWFAVGYECNSCRGKGSPEPGSMFTFALCNECQGMGYKVLKLNTEELKKLFTMV